MGFSWLLNTAWMIGCSREAAAFQRSTHRIAETQARLLAQILSQNRETEFGRDHRFDRIRSIRDYQQLVPLSRYEDYSRAVVRIGEGADKVLTRDPVELLEPTSGTSGGEKLIPFTATLRRQFQRAVAVWMHDLLRHRPALRSGRAYWSISPAVGSDRRTPAGIPIGFDDDAEYLGTAERWLLRRLLVAPSDPARLTDIDAFRFRTLRHLLGARDLTLISVWSPTFLTMLVRLIETLHETICDDMRVAKDGDPDRAASLREVLASNRTLPEKLRLIWPHLGLISCWGDAGAASYLGQLQELFPHVEIQPKGLLATEGCVSVPVLGQAAPVLAIRSHFFEFQEMDSAGTLCVANELERGGRYRVVLTTGGGLYRYELRDEVEVCGMLHACPLLRFIGKSDCVSDLVGEKLAEPHVRAVLNRIFRQHHLEPIFSLLVPAADAIPCYRLYLQSPQIIPGCQNLNAIRQELEAGLRENPHYAYAVKLGQLAPAQIAIVDPLGENGWHVYERQAIACGQRAGNIKPMMLATSRGWPALLDPLCRSAHPTASQNHAGATAEKSH